jgi:hypothetical protein
MKLHGVTGFDLVTKFTTDDLCCAISGGNISGQTFYCGSYSDKCVLYSLSYDDDNQLRSPALPPSLLSCTLVQKKLQNLL